MTFIKNKLSIFTNQEGKGIYFRNTFWLLSEKILRMLAGLFVGVWLARYLGPEKFGLLSYVQSFVAIFTVIATFGLDNIVIRELVKNGNDRDVLLGTAFILKLAGAIGVLLILSMSFFIQPSDNETNIMFLIIASSTVFQSLNVIDFYFQSKVLSKYIVYCNIFSLFLSSVIKIVLIICGAPLVFFAYVIMFDSLLLALGYILFYLKNRLTPLSWTFDKNTAKSLLKESWPLILSGLVISLYMKVDQIMIMNMLGSIDVGEYAAAVRLSEIWYFIPVVISASLFPAILNSREISNKLYYSRIQKLYDLMVCLAFVISISMTFMADWIVNILYGQEYNQTNGVLIIHIWSAVFVFLGVASSKWFIAEGLQLLSFYRTLCGALLNICLNLFLIPLYGIYGAAIATLASQLVASYLFNISNKHARKMFILQTKALLLPFRILRNQIKLRIC